MSNFCIIAILLIFSFIGACKKEPPVTPTQPEKKITLTLQDTTCTEIWLQLTFANFTAPHSYKIYRDTTLVFTGTLFANETTFVDEGLLPQRRYNYKALRLEDTVTTDSSLLLFAKTMDTTSHNFVWTQYTIGYQFSIVRDVAIVNDTLAYAVGIFYADPDTHIGNQVPYNVARWNGKEWTLLRVMVETRQIPPTPPHYYWPDEIFGIHAFSPNEIWFATNIEFIRWDGKSEMGKEYIYMLDVPIQTLWGTSPSNMYGAGGGGSFVHYDGKNWTKMDSLTSATMTDIYGTRDGKEVWATGWDWDGRGAILRWTENSFEKIYDYQNQKPADKFIGRQSSLWIDKSKIYFVGTNGFITIYNLLNQTTQFVFNFRLSNLTYSIRGSGENNIFIAGDDGLIAHWNGNTWKSYPEFINSDKNFYSVAVTKNLVIAGGVKFTDIYRSGIVIMGRK